MDEGYISDKKVILNSPGDRVSSIYYSKGNSRVDQAEVTFNFGRFSQTLTSLQLGAQSTLILPRASIVKNVMMHFQLPALVADQTLPRGWGYALIRNISYLLGSSTQVQINGQSHFQSVMLSAPSVEKRSELLKIGGEEQLAVTADAVDAYVALDLPWSSMGDGKKGIDTLLLNSPMQISIELANADYLYGGTGVRPSALLQGKMLLLQGELAYKEMSLAGALIQNPGFRYSYPYIHKQSFVLGQSCTAATPQTVQLQAFQNGDLLMVSVGIIKSSDIYDSTSNSRNPFNYEQVTDVSLLFNGTVMYNSPEKMYKLYDLIDSDPTYVQASLIAAGTTTPFTSSPINTYMLHFPFTGVNPLPFGEKTDNHFYNTWRIKNNTLSLTFTPASTTDYTLYFTYYYNSIASMNQDCVLYQD